MRSTLLALSLLGVGLPAPVFADFAPDAVARSLFTVTITPVEVSATQQITHLLRDDGTYREVALPVTFSRSVEIGTFTYTKTSATTAELALDQRRNAAPTTFLLTFTAPGVGTYTTDAVAPRVFAVIAADAGWHLANLSNRGTSLPGTPCIAGFVIEGTQPRLVLVRVAGPALLPFGVSGAAADPALRVYRGNNVIAANDDWIADGGQYSSVAEAIVATGAFPFADGSRDAALVLSLPPGSYTIHGTVTRPGEVLVEVYVIP